MLADRIQAHAAEFADKLMAGPPALGQREQDAEPEGIGGVVEDGRGIDEGGRGGRRRLPLRDLSCLGGLRLATAVGTRICLKT